MNSIGSKRKTLDLSFPEREPETHMKDESDNGSEMEQFFALLDRIKDANNNNEENIKNRTSAWKPTLWMEDFLYGSTSSATKERGHELKDLKSPTQKSTQKQETLNARSFDLNVEATPEPQSCTPVGFFIEDFVDTKAAMMNICEKR